MALLLLEMSKYLTKSSKIKTILSYCGKSDIRQGGELLSPDKQGRLWHGPGVLVPVCCHLSHSHNAWSRIKGGSLHAPLLGLWFTSGTDLAAAEA